MFVSNETEAIEILKDFGASYVVVFTTFQEDGSDVGWGDEGKWRWMARIAGLDDNSYGNYTLGIDWVDTNGNNQPEQGELVPNVNGTSSVLYKLMRYGREVTIYGYSITELEHFVGPPEGFFSQKTGSVRSYANVIPLVCVYRIKYD
jgi:hypothetical protein